MTTAILKLLVSSCIRSKDADLLVCSDLCVSWWLSKTHRSLIVSQGWKWSLIWSDMPLEFLFQSLLLIDYIRWNTLMNIKGIVISWSTTSWDFNLILRSIVMCKTKVWSEGVIESYRWIRILSLFFTLLLGLSLRIRVNESFLLNWWS